MTPGSAENIVASVLFAFLCLLIAVGILLNAFIVAVNLNNWMKSQPLQAIDVIITSLAILRIILLFMNMFIFFSLPSGQPLIKINTSTEYLMVLTTFVQFCNLWWGSVLCVFYCVKITNYKNRLLVRLKMNISRMVPRLLLTSMILSFVTSLPYQWFGVSIQYVNGTNGPTSVITYNFLNNLMISLAGSIIPFVVFCISIGLVIVSLLRHNRNLRSRGSGFSDAQRDVHLSVIRNMFSFLLFYVLFFLGNNLLSVDTIYYRPLLTFLVAIFYVASPSLHSISLIVSSRELKNAFLTVLHCSWIKN